MEKFNSLQPFTKTEQSIIGLVLVSQFGAILFSCMSWYWPAVVVGMLMREMFRKFKVIEFVLTFSVICKW